MKYIGIDYHKQYFVATTMDERGKVIRKDKVSTDRDSIRSVHFILEKLFHR